MAANKQPIFTGTPDVQWVNGVSAGNSGTNITVGTSYTAFTSSATDGGYVQRIRFRPLGTNIATVAKVWLNNGSATGTTANTILFDEVSLAASVASSTSALSNTELPLNFALPASYRIYVSLGTGVAAGYDVSVIGGKY